jgi:hypothetical protein
MSDSDAAALVEPCDDGDPNVTTKRAGNAKAMADISNRCLSDLPVSQFNHSARTAC